MLRLCGAELREVPAVPYKDPNNYVHVAERLAQGAAARFWANQWDNTANRDGHYRSTGPEIWEQTDGQVDGFACAIGTGGTLAGVGAVPEGEEPATSASRRPTRWAPRCTHWFKHGSSRPRAARSPRASARAASPKNVEGAPVDDAYQIPDSEALPLLFDLLKEEGLCLGGSSGINVAGAIRLAKELGPGPHDRDDPRRLRHALPVEALQPARS